MRRGAARNAVFNMLKQLILRTGIRLTTIQQQMKDVVPTWKLGCGWDSLVSIMIFLRRVGKVVNHVSGSLTATLKSLFSGGYCICGM